MNLRNNKTDNKFQNYINSARQLGITRNREWLKKMIYKGKICYLSIDESYKVLSDASYDIFTEQLFTLITVFERKFVDKWDIHVNFKRIANKTYYEISFIIHYPKTQISNSNEQSRELLDLIVVLPISFSRTNNCVYTKHIQGTRVTLLQDEWTRGYMHSHLPLIPKLINHSYCLLANNFCIGSEDLSELDIELSVEFDADKFELMLYTIDSFVAWESLEGGPYYKLSNIVIEDVLIRVTTDSSKIVSIYQNFKNNELDALSKLPFNFVFIDGIFKIKKDLIFIEFIKNSFLKNEHLIANVKDIICKKGTDNKFYTYPNLGQIINSPVEVMNNLKSIEPGIPFLYIQGKELNFNILPIETTTIDISEYGVYPKFLDYVAEQLESQIYKACVRGSGIHYIENSNKYVRRNSEQNQIPL